MKISNIVLIFIVWIVIFINSVEEGKVVLFIISALLFFISLWIIDKGEKIIHAKEQYWKEREKYEYYSIAFNPPKRKDPKGLFLVVLGYTLLVADFIGYLIGLYL